MWDKCPFWNLTTQHLEGHLFSLGGGMSAEVLVKEKQQKKERRQAKQKKTKKKTGKTQERSGEL